jgi:pyruvate dehydrogenase E2 component (dihydrolipoamide acetyltransferase)
MPPAVSVTEIAMPRLSDSMEEGTIVRWLVDDGATVTAGQELVEIETDKATMPFEAESGGVLAILAGEGDTVAVGGPLARLEPPGAGPAGNGAGPRTGASPVARRIAREHAVDLGDVTGSGRGGRITRRDVEAALAASAPPTPGPPVAPPTPAAPAAPPPAASSPTPATPAPPPPAAAPPTPAAPAAPAAKGAVEVVELNRTQATIARRMAEAKATVPEFVLSRTVAMDAAVALRDMLRDHAGDLPLPSYNDMVVRACALALRAFPRANGAYRDGHVERYDRVNVGVAVAADDALLVPTIFDADSKSLGTIAREVRVLAGRCRDGSITPPELAGGTFSVSNLGMFGVDRFTAVINPPQAAILAVGALRRQPVVREDALAIGHTLELTLTCDHRILYGARGAELLGGIAARLEAPTALLL